MPIAFTCPHCGAATNVADQYAGQTGPCTACGKTITIPYSPAGKVAAPSGGRSGGALLVAGIVGAGLFAFLICGGPVLVALLLPAVQSAREAARRMTCSNNMKQISLAMHNYHDVHQSFPPAYLADEEGKPMHSWRTLLLPFVEQSPLYDQYNWDEPWDSPANRSVVETSLSVFGCPSDPDAATNLTSYFVIVAPNSAFPDNGEAIAINKVSDGTSNTLMIVEVPMKSVQWAEPQDVTEDELLTMIDQQQGNHPGGFNAALLDGSVRFINFTIDAGTLRAMITRDGGEAVMY